MAVQMIMKIKFKKGGARLLGQSKMSKSATLKFESPHPKLSLFSEALLLTFWLLLLAGCSEPDESFENEAVFSSGGSAGQSPENVELPKGDENRGAFPAEQDLVLIVPNYRAVYPVLDSFKVEWLDAVDDALLASEMNQRMSEENKPEDWSLVSVRVSPCSPLGSRAVPEEIDRLCWPEIRLVLQPIVQLIRGRSSPFLFSEDRAIHALYRVEPEDESLLKLIEQLELGYQLEDLDPEELEIFEQSRDAAVHRMLKSVQKLRVMQGPYYSISERPEFSDAETEKVFWERFTQNIIEPYCAPEALYHLTAMSLPLGRAPVRLDLWSFVAFDARDGVLEPAPLEIFDRKSGEVFFSFDDIGKRSEDVTAARADSKLLSLFPQLDEYTQERLTDQTILDRLQLSVQAPEIIDPYQTLVKHTTCSSCHRFNDTPFNFHNLSYFGDREIHVSPRVVADIRRDQDWLKRLYERTPK